MGGRSKYKQEELDKERQEIDVLIEERAELYKLILADTATERQRQRYRAINVRIEAKEARINRSRCEGYEVGISMCNYYNSK